MESREAKGRGVDAVIVRSARKHQIFDDDMLHPYRHPIRVFDVDDLTMLIGADTAAQNHGVRGTDWPRVSGILSACRVDR